MSKNAKALVAAEQIAVAAAVAAAEDAETAATVPLPLTSVALTEFVAAIVPTVVCSGTSHSDPGFPWPFAFDDGEDHTALSDAAFLTYVQRKYRVVQTGPPSGPTANGFGSCPLWFSAADASAATVSIQTLDALVPFEVV